MRVAAVQLAATLAVAAALTQPQPTTSDGIDAFVRGDFAQAAAVLKPLAESWPPTDHVAEFFMATLYESGQGVQADRVKACALYARAAQDRGTVIGGEAAGLMQSLQGSMSAEDFRRCNLLANIGFDHAFQPVTFTLDQAYWVSLDLEGATVAYQGTEKRTNLGLATGGIVFLPVEHTELIQRGTRRHFLEFSTWLPAANRTWMLRWTVFEVVRHDLIPVTSAMLVTSGAGRPRGPVDIHALAHLQINERDDAEWVVAGGHNQGSGRIESDAERQERAERARARQAADAQVDWAHHSDLHRSPALAYADAGGCADIFVYGWSADRTEAISIRAVKDALGLSTTPRTFDLTRGGIDVVVHVYEQPRRSWPFCTDVGDFGWAEATWRATRGSVTIELSPSDAVLDRPNTYRATIRIVGAEFVSATGVRATQTTPIVLRAVVGGISGGDL